VLVDRGEITPRQLLDTPTDDAEYALLAGAPSWTEAVERLHVGYAALSYACMQALDRHHQPPCPTYPQVLVADLLEATLLP